MSTNQKVLDDSFPAGRFQFYTGRRAPDSIVREGYVPNGLGLNGFIPGDYVSTEKRKKKNRVSSTPGDSDSVASFDSTGKQKSFHRVCTRFAEKTSMQGVPYIHNAKLLWAKIAWTILTLLAIGAMIWHLYYLISQFYDWPKITKISLGFNSLRLPDVTICNSNVMKHSKIGVLPDADGLKEIIAYLHPSNLASDIRNEGDANTNANTGTNGVISSDNGQNSGSNPGGTDNTESNQQNPQQGQSGGKQSRKRRFINDHSDFNFDDYNYKTAEGPHHENDFAGETDVVTEIQNLFTSLYMDLPRHDRADIGHQISDMLVSCTFNGRMCGAEMFELHQTSEFGNCWRISSENFIARSSGPAAGLQLILYMETVEYIPGVSNGYGARLAITEPGTYPFPFDEGLDISSAMETSIGLKSIHITRLGSPYSTCEEGTAFKNQYNTTYSRRACQVVCEVNALLDICGCSVDGAEEVLMMSNSTYRPCRTDTEIECMYNTTSKLESQEINCDCLNPCSEKLYEKSWSQRQWPSDSYADVLLKDVCEEKPEVCHILKERDSRELNFDFLKLNIYYEDLNYEVIDEEPEIAWTQFLSDVGGAIGLWIGLSVLAFCEVFQLIIELCDYGIHRLKKKQKRERDREKEKEKNRRKRKTSYRDVENFGQWPHTEFDPYIAKGSTSITNYKKRSRDDR